MATRTWRPWMQVVACAGVALCLAGCSLLTVKSPERPLSTRDLNARILTRELSSQFIASVARCAEEIAASEHDAAVLDHALRWEISAVAQSRGAATRMAPMMGLLDTWAFATQQQQFVDEGGPGAALFGAHQTTVREIVDSYASDAQALARKLSTRAEFSDYQGFVTQYVRDHPLKDLTFARPSVVELWIGEKGTEVKLVDSLGTIPEAMADAEDRLQIYGETVPAQLVRRTQLALREAGYTQSDVESSLRQLDERLARLTTAAESAPDLVHGAVTDVRQSLRDVLDRLDASSVRTTQALRAERIALYAEIQTERAAILAAVDAQRKALAQDAGQVAERAAKSAGEQLRYLAGEVLLLLIMLTLLVLGLPFVAGYLVGRARQRRS